MGFNLEQKEKRLILTIDGELTIETAANLKSKISSTISELEEFCIDFGGATHIDLSSIQLLCSTNRTLEKQKKKRTKIGKVSDLVVSSLEESGYNGIRGCPGAPCKNCLWKGDK